MVTTCHGFLGRVGLESISLVGVQAVIAISKPVAQHLKGFWSSENKIHLIANGIDLDRFVMTDDQMRYGRHGKNGIWGIRRL
jgi:glycosyltransferase involved in cell wall biosynthesis